MNIRLIIYVGPATTSRNPEEVGALVRLFNEHDEDPHLDFIPDFDDTVLSNGRLKHGAYELIESDGVYGIQKISRRLSTRERKWVEKFAKIPEDEQAEVEMCTLENHEPGKSLNLRLHDEESTLIPVFNMRNRLGPVPKAGGIYAVLLTLDGTEAFQRIIKPITLNNVAIPC